MIEVLPHRRPVLGKLWTSTLKRWYRLRKWRAGGRGDDNGRMRCRYFGVEFLIQPGELISDEIAINRFEWRELTMMLAACRQYRPDLFIDVGANIGLYSCILGKAAVVPKVLAFEPDRGNYAGLTDNIRHNGLADVIETRPLALGARPGTATLVPGGGHNRGLSKIDAAHPDGYTVDVVTLDDILDIAGRPLAIKIDVEGYELEVLAGAARLFRRNGGYAQIEGLDDRRAAEITDVMQGYGWRFVDRDNLDLRFERGDFAS